MLELGAHQSAIFVTLTYANEFLPSPPSVSKRELQLFFKRLRKHLGDMKIRYYACGEYGDQFKRPHYHAIIYGLDKSHTDLIQSVWAKGYIEVKEALPDRMAYVAGYVSKKIYKNKDTEDGLEKEFALMSRKPALGSCALEKLAKIAFLQHPYDVLKVLRIQGRNIPLDRTIREKLRALVMSPEEIEHIKGLNKELMQDELASLIGEYFGESASSHFLRDVNDEKLHWQDKEKFSYWAGYSYDAKHYQELDAKERIKNRRNVRKDL